MDTKTKNAFEIIEECVSYHIEGIMASGMPKKDIDKEVKKIQKAESYIKSHLESKKHIHDWDNYGKCVVCGKWDIDDELSL